LDTTSLDPLENTEDPNMYDAWTQDIEWIAKLFDKTFIEDLSDLETKIATRLVDTGYLRMILMSYFRMEFCQFLLMGLTSPKMWTMLTMELLNEVSKPSLQLPSIMKSKVQLWKTVC